LGLRLLMPYLILAAPQLLLLPADALNRGGRQLLGLSGPLDAGDVEIPQREAIRGVQVDV
jgi:hypothetical protein